MGAAAARAETGEELEGGRVDALPRCPALCRPMPCQPVLFCPNTQQVADDGLVEAEVEVGEVEGEGLIEKRKQEEWGEGVLSRAAAAAGSEGAPGR